MKLQKIQFIIYKIFIYIYINSVFIYIFFILHLFTIYPNWLNSFKITTVSGGLIIPITPIECIFK
mgnify:CR=1 FL=1